jgi:hypothetical protein
LSFVSLESGKANQSCLNVNGKPFPAGFTLARLLLGKTAMFTQFQVATAWRGENE